MKRTESANANARSHERLLFRFPIDRAGIVTIVVIESQRDGLGAPAVTRWIVDFLFQRAPADQLL